MPPCPADTLVRLSASAKTQHHLVFPPAAGMPGLLCSRANDVIAYRLVQWGEPPKELWSGPKGTGASATRSPDGRTFVLTEYKILPDFPLPNRVRVYDGAGEPLGSWTPAGPAWAVAALNGGDVLLVHPKGMRDPANVERVGKDGRAVVSVGPFFVRACESNPDGTRVLVDLTDGAGPMYQGAAMGEVIADLAAGKLLYRCPAAEQARLAPDGRLLVTVEKNDVAVWREGKLAKKLTLPSPAAVPVFSADGSLLGFGVGEEYHVYRAADLVRAAVLAPPSGYNFVASGASVADSGRVLITASPSFTQAKNRNTPALLYDPKGELIWSLAFQRGDRKKSLTGSPFLSADGAQAYFTTPEQVFRVMLPEAIPAR